MWLFVASQGLREPAPGWRGVTVCPLTSSDLYFFSGANYGAKALPLMAFIFSGANYGEKARDGGR